MVSAVRVDGERLHVRARRGEVVERKPRPVTIHDIVLADFEPGERAEASFLVTSSAGTYVRTLAADVGARLGVGAHLAALRRLGSGRFSIDDAHDLEEIVKLGEDGRIDDALIPMAEAVADYPRITVDDDAARAVRYGRWLPRTGHDGPVAVVERASGALLAMVRDVDDHAKPELVLEGM